jgi:hypothetical protein
MPRGSAAIELSLAPLLVHDTAYNGVPFLSSSILGGRRIDGPERPTEYPLGDLVAGRDGVQCQGED